MHNILFLLRASVMLCFLLHLFTIMQLAHTCSSDGIRYAASFFIPFWVVLVLTFFSVMVMGSTMVRWYLAPRCLIALPLACAQTKILRSFDCLTGIACLPPSDKLNHFSFFKLFIHLECKLRTSFESLKNHSTVVDGKSGVEWTKWILVSASLGFLRSFSWVMDCVGWNFAALHLHLPRNDNEP